MASSAIVSYWPTIKEQIENELRGYPENARKEMENQRRWTRRWGKKDQQMGIARHK
jgi:hypothetical protein